MKLPRLFLVVGLALLPLMVAVRGMAADADSVLAIPEDFNVLYVDGKKHAAGFFSAGDTRLKLASGEHRLVLKYDQVFGDGDNVDRIKSEPFMLGFALPEAGEYRLLFAAISSADKARQFASKPLVEIKSVASGQAIAVQIAAQLEKTEFLAGFSKPQPAVAGAAGKPALESVVQKKEPVMSGTLEQLHYWWQQASVAERELFLQQVSRQP